PLLQYSSKRLPVALYSRPEVAAAAQGAVLLMWPPSVDSRTTAWPFGVGVVLLWSQERPSEILFDGAPASAVKFTRMARKPYVLSTWVLGAKCTPDPVPFRDAR